MQPSVAFLVALLLAFSKALFPAEDKPLFPIGDRVRIPTGICAPFAGGFLRGEAPAVDEIIVEYHRKNRLLDRTTARGRAQRDWIEFGGGQLPDFVRAGFGKGLSPVFGVGFAGQPFRPFAVGFLPALLSAFLAAVGFVLFNYGFDPAVDGVFVEYHKQSVGRAVSGAAG